MSSREGKCPQPLVNRSLGELGGAGAGSSLVCGHSVPAVCPHPPTRGCGRGSLQCGGRGGGGQRCVQRRCTCGNRYRRWQSAERQGAPVLADGLHEWASGCALCTLRRQLHVVLTSENEDKPLAALLKLRTLNPVLYCHTGPLHVRPFL
jgi:hypothetical protein